MSALDSPRGAIVDVAGQLNEHDRMVKFDRSLAADRRKNPDCPAGEACVICGKRVYPVVSQVHMGPGGEGFMPAADPDYAATEEMGWWAIGPECAKKLPAGYVITNKKD